MVLTVLTELHSRENLTGMDQKITIRAPRSRSRSLESLPGMDNRGHMTPQSSQPQLETRALSFNFGVLDDVADLTHQMMAPRRGRIWVWSSSFSSIDKAPPSLSTPWEPFWDQNPPQSSGSASPSAPGTRSALVCRILFHHFSTQQIHQWQTPGQQIQKGGGGRVEQRRRPANRYPIPRSTAQKLPRFLPLAGSFLISWSKEVKLRQQRREEGQKMQKHRLKETQKSSSSAFWEVYAWISRPHQHRFNPRPYPYLCGK